MKHKKMQIFSIKHDLAISCFQLWPKIGDEGDKISRKKTGEALAETVFSRNFVTLGHFQISFHFKFPKKEGNFDAERGIY